MKSSTCFVLFLVSAATAIPLTSTELENAEVAPKSHLEARYTTWNGVATYYYQDGAAGSCGQYHQDSDFVVAISERSPFTYNAHCGQYVTIRNEGGGGSSNKGKGKVITALVADTCPSCKNSHLDLSVGAFQALTGGSLSSGEFNIQWHLD